MIKKIVDHLKVVQNNCCWLLQIISIIDQRLDMFLSQVRPLQLNTVNIVESVDQEVNIDILEMIAGQIEMSEFSVAVDCIKNELDVVAVEPAEVEINLANPDHSITQEDGINISQSCSIYTQLLKIMNQTQIVEDIREMRGVQPCLW